MRSLISPSLGPITIQISAGKRSLLSSQTGIPYHSESHAQSSPLPLSLSPPGTGSSLPRKNQQTLQRGQKATPS